MNGLEDKLISMWSKIDALWATVWAYTKSWALLGASRACVRIFLILVKRPWTGVADVVRAGVVQNTRANIALFLMQNRIAHCRVCLSLESLRRHPEGGLVCPRHAPTIVAA